MKPEELKSIFVRNAIKSYRKADSSKWTAALWCWKVVGNYERGATLGLSADMGVSPDTIEDMAHAYDIFVEMCAFDNHRFHQFVFGARLSGYIYLSHFRSLYEIKNKYNLTTIQVIDLLNDVVQSEGQISSRELAAHAHSRYGAETDWRYTAAKLKKKINTFLSLPDLPNEGRRKAQELYEWIGENT